MRPDGASDLYEPMMVPFLQPASAPVLAGEGQILSGALRTGAALPGFTALLSSAAPVLPVGTPEALPDIQAPPRGLTAALLIATDDAVATPSATAQTAAVPSMIVAADSPEMPVAPATRDVRPIPVVAIEAAPSKPSMAANDPLARDTTAPLEALTQDPPRIVGEPASPLPASPIPAPAPTIEPMRAAVPAPPDAPIAPIAPEPAPPSQAPATARAAPPAVEQPASRVTAEPASQTVGQPASAPIRPVASRLVTPQAPVSTPSKPIPPAALARTTPPAAPPPRAETAPMMPDAADPQAAEMPEPTIAAEIPALVDVGGNAVVPAEPEAPRDAPVPVDRASDTLAVPTPVSAPIATISPPAADDPTLGDPDASATAPAKREATPVLAVPAPPDAAAVGDGPATRDAAEADTAGPQPVQRAAAEARSAAGNDSAGGDTGRQSAMPAPAQTPAAASAPQSAPAPFDQLIAAPDAPASAQHAEPRARAAAIGEDVAVAIVRHAERGSDDTLVIRLDPGDLGRIEVRLKIEEGQRLSAELTADQPATLDLLRRDSDSLSRALNDAGFRTEGQSLRFDGRGTGQGGEQGFGQQERRATHPVYRTGDEDPSAVPTPSAYPPQVRSAGRVDLFA